MESVFIIDDPPVLPVKITMIGVSGAGKTELSRRIASHVYLELRKRGRHEITYGFNLSSVVRDGSTENHDGELVPYCVNGEVKYLPPLVVVTDDINGMNDEATNNKVNLTAFHGINNTTAVKKYNAMEKKNCIAKAYVEIETMNVLAPRSLTFMNERAIHRRSHHTLFFPEHYNFGRDGYVYRCKTSEFHDIAKSLAGKTDYKVNYLISCYCRTISNTSFSDFIKMVVSDLINNYDKALMEENAKYAVIRDATNIPLSVIANFSRGVIT